MYHFFCPSLSELGFCASLESSMDSDRQIAYWIVEYLIWQPLEASALGRVLRALPRAPTGDLKLQRLLFLQVLHLEASKRSISEKTLHYFQCMEGIESGLGNAISDAMKIAFCLAAVDCTVKLLTAGDGDDPERRLKFSETVERVWREKIGRIEIEGGRLGSDLLWEWRDDIVAAVNDEGAFERVVSNFEGVEAVEAIEDYLREERERMGTPFLRRVEEGMRENGRLQNILGVDGIHQVGEEIDVAGGEGEEGPPSLSLSSSS